MNAFMEAVLSEVRDEPSALARARLQRQLTPDDAALRAGLTPPARYPAARTRAASS